MLVLYKSWYFEFSIYRLLLELWASCDYFAKKLPVVLILLMETLGVLCKFDKLSQYNGDAADFLLTLTVVHLYFESSRAVDVNVRALDGDLCNCWRCFDPDEASERPLDSVSLEGFFYLLCCYF